jgi:hypothetical protein
MNEYRYIRAPIPNLPTGTQRFESGAPKREIKPDGAVSGRLLISTEAEPSKRKKTIFSETKEICGDTKAVAVTAGQACGYPATATASNSTGSFEKEPFSRIRVPVRAENNGRAMKQTPLTAISWALQKLCHGSVAILRRRNGSCPFTDAGLATGKIR